MTIHELEKRTGLPRASIRFYEKEGLIAPKRLANGYRDYSEEEALTLEKIALLRRLDFTLERVRQVQRGELPLGVALENQREVLLEQRAEKEKALYLCDVIHQDSASYQTLQPEKYKDQLPPPSAAEFRQLPQPEWIPAHSHAIRRLWAAGVDSNIFALPLTALTALFGTPQATWAVLALSFLSMILSMVVIEPLLLSTWGTTPGKWVLDLRLRVIDDTGLRKLTYREALRRTVKRWIFGQGLNIPGLGLIAVAIAFRRALNDRPQPWDEITDYTVMMPSNRRSFALAAGIVAIVLAGRVWMENAAMFPKLQYMDTVTPELYADIVNDYLHKVEEVSCLTLQPDGNWQHTCQEGCRWSVAETRPLIYTIEEGEIRAIGFSDVNWYTDDLANVVAVCRICPEGNRNGFDRWSLLKRLNTERDSEWYRTSGVFEVVYDTWHIRWDADGFFMRQGLEHIKR